MTIPIKKLLGSIDLELADARLLARFTGSDAESLDGEVPVELALILALGDALFRLDFKHAQVYATVSEVAEVLNTYARSVINGKKELLFIQLLDNRYLTYTGCTTAFDLKTNKKTDTLGSPVFMSLAISMSYLMTEVLLPLVTSEIPTDQDPENTLINDVNAS